MINKIKKLGTDTLTYGVSNVLGRFLNFLLTPMYSNLLVGDEYEFIIYIYTLFAFINVIYSIGMESAFFRFYKQDNPAGSKSVFSHSFVVINIISLIFTAIIVLFSDSIGNNLTKGNLDSAGELIRIAALIPLFDALVLIPFGYLRMTNQAKKFSVIKFIFILITVILNFVLLKYTDLQSRAVLYSQLLASFLGFIYFAPLIFKQLELKYNAQLFNNMLKFGIPTIPASISAIILQVADRPILTELSSSYHAVVTYQVNYRLGIPMMIFVTIFEYAWKPFYLNNYNESNAKEIFSGVLSYFTIVASIIFMIITLFIEFVVKLPGIGGKYFINPEYWDGLGIVPIILFAYYFNGLFTNFSAGLLIEKKTKYLPLAVGTAAIANVVINLLLIPIIGFIGAAISTLVAYMISAIIIYVIMMRIYPISYDWQKIMKIIIITGVFFSIDKWGVNFDNLYLEFISKLFFAGLFITSLIILKVLNIEDFRSILKIFGKK